MIENLIQEISQKLHIPLDIENEKSLGRVIYSISGRQALECLWDSANVNDEISVQHFTKRAEQSIKAFEGIFPHIKTVFPSMKIISKEILGIYRRSGFLYHSPHHLSPSMQKSCKEQQCVLYRGCVPGQVTYMSGLGFYSFENPTKNSGRAVDVFSMNQALPLSYLNDAEASEWRDIEWPENTEFLRMEPPFYRGTWKNKPDKVEDRISMARYGEPHRIYVLYRYRGGKFQQQVIDPWRIQDYRSDRKQEINYWEITNAILARNGTLPAIQTVDHGSLVEIYLQYRLPPAEEDFFKLYGWPLDFNEMTSLNSFYKRVMSKPIYSIFTDHLESLGYTIEER